MDFAIDVVPTKPFEGQKPGTSGLRKKVSEVSQPHYIHNFVQSIFNALPSNEIHGSTIVVGGDGRYFNNEAIQVIIKIAAANGVGKLLIGKDGIFSTPAVSACVRKRKAYGAIILTASHNPGGPTNDFGIKYNTSNGGPAPESVTNAIYDHTRKISEYKIAKFADIDITKLGRTELKAFSVEVIDSLEDYVELMKSIFDFSSLRKLLARPGFKCLFDSMHGVTGPYVRRIFVDELGASPDCCMHTTPLSDFGQGHPDPNLTYAHHLVEKVLTSDSQYDLGAAFDGDGDRNMILGKNFFVTPSDSVAIIAARAQASIPFFSHGVAAVSRSMPTSQALDRVAKKMNLPFYEVPTGWKFFGNLMDHYEKEGNSGFICGEESFGTGSAHIREKDGIWAILAWLSILSHANPDASKPLVSVGDIVRDHWKTYGRDFYCRYDYEECDAVAGDKFMQHLRSSVSGWSGSTVQSSIGPMKIVQADDFEYKDPVDHSVSSKQGIRIKFEDGSRIVYRLSGTGSVGATIRVYIEKYEPQPSNHGQVTAVALEPLIKLALELSKLQEFTGRDRPTVIT